MRCVAACCVVFAASPHPAYNSASSTAMVGRCRDLQRDNDSLRPSVLSTTVQLYKCAVTLSVSRATVPSRKHRQWPSYLTSFSARFIASPKRDCATSVINRSPSRTHVRVSNHSERSVYTILSDRLRQCYRTKPTQHRCTSGTCNLYFHMVNATIRLTISRLE